MINTIERKKTKGGNYEYFIADIDGNLVKALTGYYKGRVIAEISENQINNDKGHYYQYYEFDYIIYTDKKDVDEKGYLDTGLDYPEYSNWTRIIGGNEIGLKAIISDDGEILLDMIESIDEYIPEAEAFVVTLPHHIINSVENCWFETDWKNSEGEDSKLRCVISINGDFIVKPVRFKVIKYLSSQNLFSVGNFYLYNLDGEKEDFTLTKNLKKNPIQIKKYALEKEENKFRNSFIKIYDLTTGQVGLIRNGFKIIDTIYDDLITTIWKDVFRVSKDNKYGFIKVGIYNDFEPILLPLLYDEVIELPIFGYLCKIDSETKIHYLNGFDENGDYSPVIYNSIDETEVITKIKEIFKDN